jgi:hypothetical protein
MKYWDGTPYSIPDDPPPFNQPIPEPQGYTAVSLTHLYTGKLLMWNYGQDEYGHTSPDVRLWDIATQSWPTNKVFAHDSMNLFCAGTAQLPDGRIFTAGGHTYNDYGADGANIFPSDNPAIGWQVLKGMGVGRWYPTAIHYLTGNPGNWEDHVFVHGGTYGNNPEETAPRHITRPQSYKLTGTNANLWTDPPKPRGNMRLPSDTELMHYYPHLFILPNGKIFRAGPEQPTYYWDPANPFTEWTKESTSNQSATHGEYASSVMYDAVLGKIMKCGGNSPASKKVSLYTYGTGWTESNVDMNHARRLHNLVILPDGKVLAVGGVKEWLYDYPVLIPEIWDPASNTWTDQPPHPLDIPRWYHSTATLLPDGRVFVAGGDYGTPVGNYHGTRFYHVFKPPYLNTGSARPTVTAYPSTIQCAASGTFSVTIGTSDTITRACLIRLGTTTHGFDSGQRYVPLTFSQDGNTLTVNKPTTWKVAPPGYYLLFVMKDASGEKVPSVGVYVRVTPE